MGTIRTRVSAVSAVAIVAMLALALTPLAASAHAPGGSAHATLTENSTCRASVLRITAPIIGTIEPTVVENTAGQTCTNKTATLLGPLGIPGVLLVSAGTAKATVSGTVNHPNPSSALVVNLNLGVPLLPAIGVTILGSTASALQCSGPFGLPTSRPTLTSGGAVAGLTIGGQPIAVGTDPVTINLFVATLSLNKITQTQNQITRQALNLSVPLLGISVVIAETKAGWIGNPCDGHT